MRICRNSAAWILLQIGGACGQLPYHAFKLLGSNYAHTQNAFQKLCGAEYLEVVKVSGRKNFFVTDAGVEAYCRVRQKDRRKSNAFIWDKPTGTHNIEKAVRLSRINEAWLFFVLLCGRKYQTSLQIKREQERQAIRSTDSLKYSRFVGCIYDEERFLHPVYHFGNGNQRLNPNGEKNAAVRHKPLSSTLTRQTNVLASRRWKNRRSLRQVSRYPCCTDNGWNCWNISDGILTRERRCA